MSQTIEMPTGYIRCTATEGSCPLRETCLRSKVHREAAYSGNYYGLTVVNLWNADIKPQTAECQAYRKAETLRFARGFSRLFDPVPKGVYAAVRMAVESVFSSRRTYYYCRRGDQLTSPEEQQKIARIFEKYGVAQAPQYDEMVDVYDWN